MSNSPDSSISTPDDSQPPSREEMLAAMFANMVIQQANMAMMLMGKMAHPETGQFMYDLEAARMFIDQLEMLEAKTKGNLSKQEEGLMKQALSALHMTFVEAVNAPPGAESQIHPPTEPLAEEKPIIETASAAPTPTAVPAPTANAETKPTPAIAPETTVDDSRKKFSKKY